MSRKTVLLGLGNPLYSDDGFGVEVIARFCRQYGAGPEVEAVDGGTQGLALMGYMEDAAQLLLFDAVQAEAPAGTVVEFTGQQLARGMPLKLSQHQAGIEEVLGLVAWRGRLPHRTLLIGVVPKTVGLGYGLSDVVEAAVPVALQRAVTVLREWGIQVWEQPAGP